MIKIPYSKDSFGWKPIFEMVLNLDGSRAKILIVTSWLQVVSYNLEWWKIFGQMKGNGGQVDPGSPRIAPDESIYTTSVGPWIQS